MEKMENEDSSNSLEVIEMNGHRNESEENVQEDDISSSTDGDELLMTEEEAKKLVLKKMDDLFNDPKTNPLLASKLEIIDYLKKIKGKVEELDKVWKTMEVLYRSQVKFLQHQGLLVKANTSSIGVGIDLPILPETLSNILQPPGPSTSSNMSVKPVPNPGPVEFIDLTDDVEPTVTDSAKNISSSSNAKPVPHPAPLTSKPGEEVSDSTHKPQLKIKVNTKGIVLTWDLPENRDVKVDGYDVFYYQEQSSIPASSSLWKKLICVEPLPLPMSCFLSHLQAGHKYHFAVRESKKEPGPFSDAVSAMFVTKN